MNEAAPASERQSIPAPHAYRKLSEGELQLMDRINAHREATEKLLLEVVDFLSERGLESGGRGGRWRSPARALHEAADQIQTGFMWLSRAVAAPGFF
jgi:hypothetical protein